MIITVFFNPVPSMIHLQVLRVLADELAKSLSIILGKVMVVWWSSHWLKKRNITFIFKKGKKEDARSYRSVSHTSGPGKIMEQIFLKALRKKALWKIKMRWLVVINMASQRSSDAWHLVAFYNRITVSAHTGRATDIIYLDLCKTFDSVLHDMLVDKMEKCGFDGWSTC